MRRSGGSGREGRRGLRLLQSLPWRRALFILPLAVAGILLSVSVTGGALLRRAAPATALRIAPYDAQAKAAEAVLILGGGEDGPQLERAGALARQALERDPTVVGAWRSLAIIAAVRGRAAEATKLMDFASQLSRRDMPTQLWLIEDNVRQNDVIGTLQHYDIVLRTSDSGLDLLLPNLVSSISHDELVGPVAELLATNPPWLPQFFSKFGESAPAHENTAKVLELLRGSGFTDPIPYAEVLPARLVTLGEYKTASRVHAALLAGQLDTKSADDQFGRTPRITPFDWDMVSEGDVRAEPQLQDGSGGHTSLYVFGDQGQTGIGASKLFVLTPGIYQLLTDVRGAGGTAPERLTWTLQCAVSSRILAQMDVTPTAEGRRSHAAQVVVPAGDCPAQWLRLEMRAAEGPNPSEAWIDKLQVRRR